MPTRTNDPLADDTDLAHVGESAVCKALVWDRIAVKYAADPIADMLGYENTPRWVQSLLSADQDVLEFGCGTGITALRLTPCPRSLPAPDFSIGMIAIARQKLAAQPHRQLSFAVADADAPVAGGGTYDAVLAFNVLHLVADLDQALTSAKQALRPASLLIPKTACIEL